MIDLSKYSKSQHISPSGKNFRIVNETTNLRLLTCGNFCAVEHKNTNEIIGIFEQDLFNLVNEIFNDIKNLRNSINGLITK